MNKEVFVKRTEKEIDVLGIFVFFLEQSKEIVAEFNGKILNKRFYNALPDTVNVIIEQQGFLINAKYRDKYITVNGFNYAADIYTRISIVCVDKRICAQKTIDTIEKEIHHLKDEIEKRQFYIYSYDKAYEAAKEIKKMKDKFVDDYSYRLVKEFFELL